jgi:PAS domain S-box-containing protein
MTAGNVVVVASHDPWLVALSVAISIVAAYAARDLSERIRDARGHAWLAWLAGGAVADGIGTWSMHYTGMLALRLPVPVRFDWPVVLLSLLVGIVGSGATLLIVSRKDIGWVRAVAGAVVLGGVGISGLHYTAMAALRLRGYEHSYRWSELVVASVAGAMAVSLPAIAFGFQKRSRDAAAVLRGLANPVMHYTAMATVVFAYTGRIQNDSDLIDISALGVIGISVVPVMVLIVALLTSLADRLQKQRVLLDELFEQAPQAIALLSGDGHLVRVNREFTRLFGYGQEVLGRSLVELIVPPGERAEAQLHLDRAAVTAGRLEKEALRRRKDGTLVPVSIVVVPVSVPAGEVEIYTIYVDISERKAAEEAQRTFPRRLIEIQEMERQHIARELHDEIGQVLTSSVMMLTLSRQLPPDEAQSRVAEARSLLEELIGKVRGLALDLRPSVLDHFGLAAALTWFFDRYTAQTGVCVIFRDFVTEERRFSSEIETAAYRIVQEALTNVARHAHAQEATVTLLAEDEFLRIEVEDRGAGFDARDARASRSFGLTGMRERAHILRGRFMIHSSSGAGTRVVAELPLTH